MSSATELEIVGPVAPERAHLLSDDALALVARLQRELGPRRAELLAARAARQERLNAGERLDFLPETKAIREGEWRVASAPADLQNRRVEITGPAEAKMMINALNSGAKIFMCDLEDALSRHSRSSSPPAERPPSPPRFPSGTSDVASLVQLFEEQRRADRREADEQRREDRRAAEEREERYHRAAEDREARREAHHEAQLAALATRHSADKHPGGYIPNKGFNDIKPYSGDRGQVLLPWLQLFRSRANLAHTPDADIARELCLKLEVRHSSLINQGLAADASPTFAEVAAHLSKVYITPYQGAVRWGAFFRFKRPSGSSGKEVKQQLHNARQGCLDEGIPLDELSELSSAEHLYYFYQLSLTPAQSAQFLASLSSNAQASDDYLRTLTPTGAADRRTSVAGPTSSAARTALFQLRVTLIEAFLDHDCGDAGQGGRGRRR